MKRKFFLVLFAVVSIVLIRISWRLTPHIFGKHADAYYVFLFGEGLEMQEKGNLAGAADAYKKAIRFNAKRYEAYRGLADVEASRGETNAALSNYDAALKYCGNSSTNFVPLAGQQYERSQILEKINKLRGKPSAPQK